MANSTLTISIAEAESDSLLPSAGRFVCLSGCGLCCSYRVLVAEGERRRLEAETSRVEPWCVGSDGQPALRRTPDFCLFLNPQRRCSIYEHRPAHCSTYPYVQTVYDGVELDVDLSCPGLGHGEEALAPVLKPPVESDEERYRRRQVLEEVRELLRVQRRYASREATFALGRDQLDELTTTWYDAAPVGACTLRVEQRQSVLINMEGKDSVLKLQQELQSYCESTRALLEDAAWLERHFAQPSWSTRLYATGRVDVYRFWIYDGVLHVEEKGGTRSATDLTRVAQIPWEPEALATREAYLRRWLGRQLLERLATNLSVASLIAVGHLAVTYLKSLLDIDQRVAVLAPALAQAAGEDVVSRALALEAVRGSDGLLRARCESARLGTTS